MLKTVSVPDKLVPLFEQAQQYVTRYFADQRSTPERGTLEISGQRYVLVRAASMSVEFYEMVRSLYGEEAEALSVAHSLLFDVAHAMGLADARAFSEHMEVTDPVARLSAGPVHFAHAGWAFVDISPESNPSPDENYYLLYDHPYSFESDSWLNARRQTGRPVCAMNAGYSSGWCEHSFGLQLVASEILCRAKGDATCRFIMSPPHRIEGHVAEYARRHPELAARIVGTQVPGFFAKRTDQQLLRTNIELERRAEERARELSLINEQLDRDIAERRRAETALGVSRELNERLIEALPGGVVQVDRDGTLISVNAEAARILGIAAEDMVGRRIGQFETVTIFEDGSRARASDFPVTKAILTGAAQPGMTFGVHKPSGEIAWAVFRAVPTRDPVSHEITGAVVTFLDITERKRFEDKLRHAQKLESLGVLAGGIAHDFNNLLATILGNTSFARTLAGADERLGPVLEEIEIGARRAAELTRQMLDYSGQGKFRLQNLDLPGAVREMTKLLRSIIPKTVEFHHHFQEGLAPIDADGTQVRQVIMNLITNAAESIGDRQGRVVVAVEQVYVSNQELDSFTGEPLAAGSFVCFEVSDTGCGMNEETRSRIFDPFFTTKFQGRGLGMATVLGIVRGHRGAINIESREGVGTRVRVLFPLKARAGELPDAAAAAGPGAAADRGVILVVDDDPGLQLLARRALSSRGWRVLTASDGAEGVLLFEQHRAEIRLVLMDMTMPRMSGLEALKRIRATGSQVPVLLSSGYNVDPVESAAQQFTGVLEKPYSVEELWEATEKAIRGGG